MVSICETCVIRNSAICAALDAAEIEALNKIGRHRTLEPGETFVWEGDESLLVGNVIDGVLKLSTGMQDGREQIVGVAFPSDFIGRPFASRARHSVTALSRAHICLFARPEFDAFASSHPALEKKLLQRTLRELDRTRDWLLLLGRKNAEEKVATFLLEMCNRLPNSAGTGQQDGSPCAFDLPFSRQQIADILGLTIETVSRQITALKRDGIIDLPSRREVIIREMDALLALAG